MNMNKLARQGDMHAGICSHGFDCCPHGVSGTITGGSPNVYANNKKLARVGDNVIHNCPHCGTGSITKGSKTVKANGKSVAGIGDIVTYPGGSGTITGRSPSVNAG